MYVPKGEIIGTAFCRLFFDATGYLVISMFEETSDRQGCADSCRAAGKRIEPSD